MLPRLRAGTLGQAAKRVQKESVPKGTKKEVDLALEDEISIH